ncbi:MAG TPA: hypothetical protein V6C58_05915 [Allocoleopsis sp.]
MISCSKFTPGVSSRDNIRDLQKLRNTNSTITITGKVSSIAPFLQGGAYQVENTTGSIWVLTLADLPQQDTQITVTGQLQYQNIPIEGKDFGEVYLQEENRQ